MTREEAIEILWRYDVNFEPHPAEEVMHAIDMAIEALQAEPNEVAEQEPKILDTIDFAIDASNGGTNYYVGFRNGLRYVKSLIDGKEPQFESCAEQEPKHGKWEDIGGVIRYGCPFCHYAQEEKSDYCPNCGADMRGEQE